MASVRFKVISERPRDQSPLREGPIVPAYLAPYPPDFLRGEVSPGTDTAAAGGNASLMAIGQVSEGLAFHWSHSSRSGRGVFRRSISHSS